MRALLDAQGEEGGRLDREREQLRLANSRMQARVARSAGEGGEAWGGLGRCNHVCVA